MKALVIGGAGFIGCHLVQALMDEGWKVTVIDSLEATGGNSPLPFGVDLYTVSARSAGAALFRDVDCVFYLAAIPDQKRSLDWPGEAVRENAGAVATALGKAVKMGVPRFIYASSWVVYGDHGNVSLKEHGLPWPKSPYALAKYMGEQLCDLYGDRLKKIRACSLRLFNVYGPGARKGVVARFVEQAGAGEPMTMWGGGADVRDFVHVSDAVRAFLKAEEWLRGQNEPTHEVCNVGTGVGRTVWEVAGLVSKGFGKRWPLKDHVVNVDPPDWYETVNIPHAVADLSRVKVMLGWKPKVALEEGVKKLCQSM